MSTTLHPGRHPALGTAPDAMLRRLEWRVLRRLDGRLQGDHRTLHRGAGLDLAGLRDYTNTDDARRIDWVATARVGETLVRDYHEDRELTVWLVLDRSASMQVGGGTGRDKAAVLTELALVLARLFGRGGNRVGAVLHDGAPRVVPPGSGRVQALRIGHELGRVTTGSSTTTDLADLLESVTVPARRRSLVIVISDFIGTGDWRRPLTRLVHRHDVVALRVVDAADDALPEVGLLVVEDAETGEQLLVGAADPLFREAFGSGPAARGAETLAVMRRAGVPMHTVGTDHDLVDALVRVVASTGWRR